MLTGTSNEVEPAAKESLYAFAYAMLHADRLPIAVRAFRVFVRFAPTDERAWLGLGACHEKLDQADVAAELFGAGAMVASPRSARCFLALARTSDDWTVAQDALEQAAQVAIDVGDADMLRLVQAEQARR